MRIKTNLLGLLFLATGCGNQKEDTGSDPQTAENTDATDVDGEGGTDAGAEDAGATDGSGIDDTGSTDTGEAAGSDTGTTEDDTASPDTGTTDSLDIEVGTRISGYILPDTLFGEVTWETATTDGLGCQIQGLMSDITLLEEACSVCDWGATFTLTGMAITLDAGACDLSVLEMEGMEISFGHGHTMLYREDDLEYYELYQLHDEGWSLRETGFSLFKEADETGMDMWAFGEEFTEESTDDVDTIEDDEAEVEEDASWVEWNASIHTSDLTGAFTLEISTDGERCTVSGEIIDIVMSEGCTDCMFGANFTLSSLSASSTETECEMWAISMEGATKNEGHGLELLYPGVPTDDRHILWDYGADGWAEMDSGWSTFNEDTSEWTFGERIVED